MSGLSAAWAQDTATHDDLEFRIEISRHERLVKRRQAQSAPLEPFRSDGCSGGLSLAWAFISANVPAMMRRHGDRPPWEACAHDQAYHMGGRSDLDAKSSFEARRTADEKFRMCVISSGEERLDSLSAEYNLSREEVSRIYQAIADIMYRAVRLGGIPCSGLPWRWGFGWPDCD
jgi:hypothetical protein